MLKSKSSVMMFILIFMKLIFLYFFIMNSSLYLDVEIISSKTSSLIISFLIDKTSLMFSLTVQLIFFSIYIYSFSYMSHEVNLVRFISLMFMFFLSMEVLIFSGNMFTSLIGWDGLGVSSFFLIIFYYSSTALKAGVLTYALNRLGDCFFIVLLVCTLGIYSNESIMNTISESIYQWNLMLLLIVLSLTKSAQIPFSSWLTAAMEAPTPVSSLVHSSTLVTAGVYVLYRYSSMWNSSDTMKILLLIVSISTLFMASMGGMIEYDLKKTIALSTLSQLGFMMLNLALNQLSQAMFHLIMHSFSKALLFMIAGQLIHSNNDWQDMRSFYMKNSMIMKMLLLTSQLSLCGMPYMSGFFSKDNSIDFFFSKESWNVIIYMLILFSFVLTVMYSFRLISLLHEHSVYSLNNWSSSSEGSWTEISWSMVILFASSCFMGSLSSWVLMDFLISCDNSKVLLICLLFVSTYMTLTSKSSSSNFSFLTTKWSIHILNSYFSLWFFMMMKHFYFSSDLLGLPGRVNLSMKLNFQASSSLLNKIFALFYNNSELMISNTFIIMLLLMYFLL